MRLLVTGAAGFIGAALSLRLLERGDELTGVDNLNDYYDVRLKQDRLAALQHFPRFHFHKLDITAGPAVSALIAESRPDCVVHLAAQAGVRYSLAHPHAYVEANVAGFLNVLEACRHAQIGHLVFASSSSVYGANTRMPFSVHDGADHPLSLYGATKRAGELMAHAYSHLYGVPVTGLRYFTVYGPWGRPDMSLFKFTRAILAGEPLDIYNHGKHRRDFTYIDDVVEGTLHAIDVTPAGDPSWSGEHPDPASSRAPFRLYNLGANRPVELLRFIEILEDCLGREARRNFLPLQPGDVPMTYADVEDSFSAFGFAPSTPIEVGISHFVAWYRDYYGV